MDNPCNRYPHLMQGSGSPIRPVGAMVLTEVRTVVGFPLGESEPRPSIEVCLAVLWKENSHT